MCKSLRDRDNLQKILERKVDLAIQGEKEDQQKLCLGVAEMEAKSWEKRNLGHAFQETNQEFESQRFQVHHASQQADQAQRDEISLHGELELRKRRLPIMQKFAKKLKKEHVAKKLSKRDKQEVKNHLCNNGGIQRP